MAILIGLNFVHWAVTCCAVFLTCALALQFYFMLKWFVKTQCDHVLVRTGFGGTTVSTSGQFVIPALHKSDVIPTSIHKLRYERSGESSLQFKCGAKVSAIADLLVRIDTKVESVERAISLLGVSRLKDSDMLREHFHSSFNDSLDTVALQTTFSDLADDKDAFRDKLIENLGLEIDGMTVADICLHHLVRT